MKVTVFSLDKPSESGWMKNTTTTITPFDCSLEYAYTYFVLVKYHYTFYTI